MLISSLAMAWLNLVIGAVWPADPLRSTPLKQHREKALVGAREKEKVKSIFVSSIVSSIATICDSYFKLAN